MTALPPGPFETEPEGWPGARGKLQKRITTWADAFGPGRKRLLASGGKSAAVGYGDAEILVGIDRSVVNADFIVEMRTGRTSALAHVADHVAAMHALSSRDGKAGEMPVAGADAVAVVDHDGLAVAAQ